MLSKRVFLISCMMVSLFARASWAEKEKTRPKAAPVLEIQDLFTSMRIPNIVVTTDGTVLAFAKSGRVLCRSEDGGKIAMVAGPDSRIERCVVSGWVYGRTRLGGVMAELDFSAKAERGAVVSSKPGSITTVTVVSPVVSRVAAISVVTAISVVSAETVVTA